jgi:transcriptional regulator with XRE-family HTH domain
MQKSITSGEYRLLVEMLRQAREARGVTQAVMAAKLGITASQVSKWERRERRIDIRELALYCKAAGIDLLQFVEEWKARAFSGEL